jgi:hypothetical protein
MIRTSTARSVPVACDRPSFVDDLIDTSETDVRIHRIFAGSGDVVGELRDSQRNHRYVGNTGLRQFPVRHLTCPETGVRVGHPTSWGQVSGQRMLKVAALLQQFRGEVVGRRRRNAIATQSIELEPGIVAAITVEQHLGQDHARQAAVFAAEVDDLRPPSTAKRRSRVQR